MPDTPPAETAPNYALALADGSYTWYRHAAIKARRYFRLAETIQILVSAAIPVSAVLFPGNTKTPALLGSLAVIITGLRSVFHWHEDYPRFSEAREAIEAERRRYLTYAGQYANPDTRDQILAESITRIEQQEMGTWMKIIGSPREAEPPPSHPTA